MKTQEFIDKFSKNTLGRKKQQGNYYTLEGEYCKVLLKRYTNNGIPGGSTVEGINFKGELTIWTNSNLTISWSVNDITDSGIIHKDDISYLLDIGRNQILVEPTPHSGMTMRDYLNGWVVSNSKIDSALTISGRYDNIKEARSSTILNVQDDLHYYMGYWMQEIKDEDVPVFPEEHRNILNTIPNPLNFDIPLHRVEGESAWSGARVMKITKIKEDDIYNPNITQYNQAKERYNTALKELENFYLKGFSTENNSNNSYSNWYTGDRQSQIISFNEDIYLKGEFRLGNSAYSKITDRVNTWHRKQELSKRSSINVNV